MLMLVIVCINEGMREGGREIMDLRMAKKVKERFVDNTFRV